MVRRVWIIFQTILVFLLVAKSLLGLAEHGPKGSYFEIKRQLVMGLITWRRRGSMKKDFPSFPLHNTLRLMEVEEGRRDTASG